MRLVFENIAHLELDVDGDARVQIVECRPQADESEAIAPSPVAYDHAANGRHGNHVRWGRPAAGCARCVASPPIAPDRPPIAGDRSVLIASDRRRLSDRVDRSIDSFDQEHRPLIDLPREDVAALRARWTRGGRSNREPFLTAEGLLRLDRIAACPDHNQAYSAAVIRQAPRGVDLLAHLERSHTELHRPAPPTPEQLAEASFREAERRRESYREQLERGTDETGQPLSDLSRSLLERSLARDGAGGEQPQGP